MSDEISEATRRLAAKLHGTYRRNKDGKSFSYWGKVWDYKFEVRIWPAQENPRDVLKLPVAYSGDLVAVENDFGVELARPLIEDFIEQMPESYSSPTNR